MTSIKRNSKYDYNTTTIQMGFRRKSNDLFESVSKEFTLLIVLCRRIYTEGKSLAIYFGDSQFRRNKIFDFIISKNIHIQTFTSTITLTS